MTHWPGPWTSKLQLLVLANSSLPGLSGSQAGLVWVGRPWLSPAGAQHGLFKVKESDLETEPPLQVGDLTLTEVGAPPSLWPSPTPEHHSHLCPQMGLLVSPARPRGLGPGQGL